jgi:hypothetical protein
MKHTVFGVHINQRVKSVPAVQAVLTKYGCNVRTRLGIHDADATSCSPSGLLLIDAFGAEIEDFYKELETLEGVDVQRMDFED